MRDMCPQGPIAAIDFVQTRTCIALKCILLFEFVLCIALGAYTAWRMQTNTIEARKRAERAAGITAVEEWIELRNLRAGIGEGSAGRWAAEENRFSGIGRANERKGVWWWLRRSWYKWGI